MDSMSIAGEVFDVTSMNVRKRGSERDRSKVYGKRGGEGVSASNVEGGILFSLFL